MCPHSTSPFTLTLLQSDVRHREQVEDLVVRCLRPPDVAIEAFLVEFRRRACRSLCTVLMLAEVDGRPLLVGHMFLRYPIGPFGDHWTSQIGGSTVEISFLAVDPDFAGLGVGQQMLQHALAFAHAHRYVPVAAIPPGHAGELLFAEAGGAAHGLIHIGQDQLQSYVFPPDASIR